MEKVDQNDAIFNYCLGDIFLRIFRAVMYSTTESHSELSQVSKIEHFARTNTGFKSTLLTIFAKSFMVDF